MVKPSDLKKAINEEADRKSKECAAANSLPANPDHPVEKPIVKKSADEAKPTSGNDATTPETTSGSKPACPEAQKVYVSPSKDLGKKRNKKSGEQHREKEYVSPSQPLAEAPPRQ